MLEKTVKNTIRTILLWIHYKSLKDREDQTGTTEDQQREPTSSKWHLFLKTNSRGFPGGSVVKNPHANAGNMGSIPGPGNPTCCGANKPVHHNYWSCAPEPRSRSYWCPHIYRAQAPQWEKSPRWEACTATRELPLTTTTEKLEQQRRPTTAKNK